MKEFSGVSIYTRLLFTHKMLHYQWIGGGRPYGELTVITELPGLMAGQGRRYTLDAAMPQWKSFGSIEGFLCQTVGTENDG
jgi:hypothetical protein